MATSKASPGRFRGLQRRSLLDYARSQPKPADSLKELLIRLGRTRLGVLQVDYKYDPTRGDVASRLTFPLKEVFYKTVESWTFEAAQRGVKNGVWPSSEFRLVKADGSPDQYWQKNWDAVQGRSGYHQVTQKPDDGYFDEDDYVKGTVMRYPPNAVESFMKQAVSYMEDESRDVSVITADVGFAMQFQKQVAGMTSISVGLSSLIQLSWIMGMHGLEDMTENKEVMMVLTANGQSFTGAMQALLPLTVPETVVHVVGLEDTEFGKWVAEGAGFTRWDEDINEASVEAAMACIHEKVDAELEELEKQGVRVVAIVSECTELPAYTNMLRFSFGLPVYDSITGIQWMAAGNGFGVYSAFMLPDELQTQD